MKVDRIVIHYPNDKGIIEGDIEIRCSEHNRLVFFKDEIVYTVIGVPYVFTRKEI